MEQNSSGSVGRTCSDSGSVGPGGSDSGSIGLLGFVSHEAVISVDSFMR